MQKNLFNTKPAMFFYKYIAFTLFFYIGANNQQLLAQNDLALKIVRTTPQQTTVGSTVTFKVQLLNEGRMIFGSPYSGSFARIPIQVPAGLSINSAPVSAVIKSYTGGTYDYIAGVYTGGSSSTITGTSGTAAAPGAGAPLVGFFMNAPLATNGLVEYSLAAETIKNADVVELELTFTVRAKNNIAGAKNNGEGVHSIKAEITAYTNTDLDSSPSGATNYYNTEIEDDVAFSCVTVPLSLCNGGSISLNANRFYSANSTITTNGLYNIGADWTFLSNPKVQWKRSTNNGVSYANVGTNSINDTTLTVTTSGWYSFTLSYDITINGTTTTCTQDVCCPIIINIVPTLTVAITPTAICARAATAIPASITGGTANYDYSWSAPAGLTLTGATTTGSSTTSNSVTATVASPPTSPTTYAVTLTVTDANGCTATDVENITVNPQPTLTVSSNPTICLGSSTVVTVTPTGGSGSYAYSWTPTGTIMAGSTTSSITVTPTAASTVYTVVVADNSGGCTASSSVTVTTNTPPTVIMPTAPAICASVSTTIDITVSSGTGIYSYLWSNGATTQDITVNPSTTTAYTVTVSNSGGNVCSTTGTTTVTVNPIPTVTMPAVLAICPSVSTTIDITVAGGTGTYTYLWSNGATTQDITVNPSITTAYTVTVSNSGGNVCSTIRTTTITVNPTPTVTMPTIPAICPSVSTAIDITVAGTPAVRFTNSANKIDCGDSPSVQISGTAITLEALIYATSWQSLFWQGNVINKEANWGNPYGYMLRAAENGKINFTFGNSTNWNDLTTAANTLALNTWYHIAATYDGTTMRIYRNGVEVASQNVSSTIVNAASSNLTIGNWSHGTDRGFIGTIDEVRVWNIVRTQAQIDADKYRTISPNTSGLRAYYKLDEGTGTTTANATGLGNSGTFLNSPLWATPIGSPLNPVTYLWSNGATTQDITVNPTATTAYTVTVSNSGGNVCSTTATTTVTVNPTPTVTIPTITAKCPSVSTTIDVTVAGGTGTYTYLWSNGATTQDIIVNPSATTVYTVTISNSGANVCSTTGTTTITVNPIPTITMPTIPAICPSTSTPIDITVSGSALSFNGYRSVKVGDPASLQISGTAITLEALIYPTNLSQLMWQSNIISKENEGAKTGYVLRAGDGGKIEFYYGNGTTWRGITTANPVLSVNTWQHVALTYNGAFMKLYVNGVEVASSSETMSLANASSDFTIGNYSNWYDRPFLGIIDEVRIWDIARTQAQIDANKSISISPASSGLKAYYKFDEGSGTSTADATSAANTGTLYNSPTWINPTYIWSNGATTQDITVNPSTTTTYTVTVTNTTTNTCSITSSVTVTVNPTPTITMPTISAKCPSINTTIDITVAGGTGTYTYLWSNGATTQDITVNPSTTTAYTVTVSNSGGNVCSTTGTTTITVNPLPTVIMPTVSPICASTSTVIDITVSGGAGTYTYLWSNGAITQDITVNPSSTTTYTVTVSNSGANVCSITATTTINVNPLPIANAGSDVTICSGTSTQIGVASVAGNTYLWSPSATLSSATVSNPTASPTATTVYTVTVTITATGCTAVDAVTVTVNPRPTVNAGSDVSICLNQSTTLSATGAGGNGGPYTYFWSPGGGVGGLAPTSGSSVTATPTAAGVYSYTVIITDGNGCTNSDAVQVTVNTLPNAGTDGTDTQCKTDAVATINLASRISTFDAGGTWTAATFTTANTGATTFNVPAAKLNSSTGVFTYTGMPAATYVFTYTITTAAGCSDTSTVTVTINTCCPPVICLPISSVRN